MTALCRRNMVAEPSVARAGTTRANGLGPAIRARWPENVLGTTVDWTKSRRKSTLAFVAERGMIPVTEGLTATRRAETLRTGLESIRGERSEVKRRNVVMMSRSPNQQGKCSIWDSFDPIRCSRRHLNVGDAACIPVPYVVLVFANYILW
jgi:hypothetical protein